MNNEKKFNKAVCAAVHHVEAGETLYGISQRYNTDYRRLMILNEITNPYNIQPGQEICIPHSPVTGTGNSAGRPGVPSRPVSDAANTPGRPGLPSRPEPGAANTPGRPGVPSRPVSEYCTDNAAGFHIISRGDTLYGISRTYGIPLSDLMSCNPEIDPYNLRIGHRLVIPAQASQSTPSESSDNSASSELPAASSGPAASSETATVSSPEPDSAAHMPQQPSYFMPSDSSASAPAQTRTSDSSGSSTQPSSSMSDGIIYTVSPGETLTSLLTRFGICFASLLNENPGTDLNGSIEGISLCIPDRDTFRHIPENRNYTVKSGDTLMKISEKTDIGTDELLRMNPGLSVIDFSLPGTRIHVR